jgi:hypothetical protein
MNIITVSLEIAGGSGFGAALKESQISVLTMSAGEYLTHCNK